MKIIAKKDLFINDEIRVREVRLVGLDGDNWELNHCQKQQAIADDANVDLVLIQPSSYATCCEDYDYGKFKFEYKRNKKNT